MDQDRQPTARVFQASLILLSGLLTLGFLLIGFSARLEGAENAFLHRLASVAVLFLASGCLSHASRKAATITRFYEITAQSVFVVAVLLLGFVLSVAIVE